jgi:HMG (high mobility group) box
MDEDAQVFRIMRIPALKSGESSRVNSPARSGSIANSSGLIQETVPSYKRKAKIPRPPNAFILYRQEHHPKIKFAHPEYHNNDICESKLASERKIVLISNSCGPRQAVEV